MIPRVYAVLLVLFPRSFTDEFGYEMMCDVRDACLRARHSRGRLGLVSLSARWVGDLARNVVIQWVRTGVPALIVISVSWTLLLFSLVALQGIPQASVLFTKLHLAWLLIAISMGLLCIAVGRYHARRWS
jgi:hypothetical protein